MDDKDIITLMFLSKSDAYLAIRLFKAKGYGKNKIKRLVYKELKMKCLDVKYSSFITIMIRPYEHLIYSQLQHKFSTNYSMNDVWKHLKIKFNKIR